MHNKQNRNAPLRRHGTLARHHSLSGHSKGHLPLNGSNGPSGVETLGASPGAVENGVAAVQRHAVVECGLALRVALVARIVDPAVRLEQNSGAEVLLAVPPVRGARGAAAGAEDALVEAVDALAVRGGLEVLLTLGMG